MQMSRAKCCSQYTFTQLQSLLRGTINHHRFTSSSSPALSHYSSSSLFAPSFVPKQKPTLSSLPHYYSYPTACRFFSSNSKPFFNSKPGVGGFAKKVLNKPAAALTSAIPRYREAVVMQIEAFFKRNQLLLLGVAGVFLCGLLWKLLFGIANTFIAFSEGMAKYGFLALSSAIVAFAGLYLRSRFTISPDKVYRMAMRRLNTSAEILEVMGAPLTGTDLRAYVMSGGGLTLKKFKPNIRSRRCFVIFPIKGSERKGLVSVEVKKKKGKYDMKLLAVDIPMASGPDQRLYLIGDAEEYRVGGGLIHELRDPVVKAMAATKEFDDLDEIEEKEDAERERLEAERERQEAERKHHEEIKKLEDSSTKQ